MTIEDSKDKKKKKKVKHDDSDCETDDEDIDEFETLLVRRFHKGKLTIICFNCNDVGHIPTRCPNNKNKDEKYGDKYKRRRDDDNKGYRDKGKKSYYIAKEYRDDE